MKGLMWSCFPGASAAVITGSILLAPSLVVVTVDFVSLLPINTADEKELEVKHRLICARLENTEKKKKRAVITTKGSTVYDPENVIAHVEFDA